MAFLPAQRTKLSSRPSPFLGVLLLLLLAFQFGAAANEITQNQLLKHEEGNGIVQRLTQRSNWASSVAQQFSTAKILDVDPSLPYRMISFTYTGSEPAICNITDGQCNQWNWPPPNVKADENQEEETSYRDNNPEEEIETGLNSISQNFTYIDHFLCSQDLSWFTGIISPFRDPVPAGNAVTQARFDISGTFVCSGDTTTFTIMLQSSQISVPPISLSKLDFPIDCSCPVCAQNFSWTTPSFAFGGGIPFYTYGGTNRIQMFVTRGAMCINGMEVTLLFQQKQPKIAAVSPNGGPRTGGTEVTIQVDNYDSALNYSCVINGFITPATSIGNQRIVCVTPNPCSVGEGRVSFSVVAGNHTIDPIFSYFTYLQPTLTVLDPEEVEPGQNITISGHNIVPLLESGLAWSCRIEGQYMSTLVWVDPALSRAVCQVPITAPPGRASFVELSLNGQNWSNQLKFSIKSNVPPKKWTDMPYLLYIILGSVVVVLLLVLLIFGMVKLCKSSSTSNSSEISPLLGKGSFGPKSPAPINLDTITVPAELEKLDVSQITLGKRIGKGSFGEVYLGSYNGTEVAVKKLPANKITDEFLREFAREAALMRTLRHPNVVQLIGATMDEPDICIVTEYMSRGSLYHILHDPNVAISWEMVRKIAIDTAKGMAYLHNLNPPIIHRDLKSHNLLVDENWRVKVCDFGLSKIAVDQQATMTACGTPCWTAPEILKNARYTTKADVFSFGIVLWELVTREEPFAGMPAFQVIFAVGTKGARLPLPSACPPELIKLIVTCWQEDPNQRPTFSEILTYLDRFNFASLSIGHETAHQ